MKQIFCTNCTKETPHKGEVDHNGEIVFTCQTKDCVGFVKFPQVQDAKELGTLIESRTSVNQPIAEAMEMTRKQKGILSEVLNDGTKVEVTETQPEATPQASAE